VSGGVVVSHARRCGSAFTLLTPGYVSRQATLHEEGNMTEGQRKVLDSIAESITADSRVKWKEGTWSSWVSGRYERQVAQRRPAARLQNSAKIISCIAPFKRTLLYGLAAHRT
jgi:hypothetical protein